MKKTKLSTISLIIHFSMLELFQPHFLPIIVTPKKGKKIYFS
jgi:hypothetical protein